MARKVFISYRRDDTAPWAGRLYERLARDFDKSQLFIDVDNIAPGFDFVKVLQDQVALCDALLAIIGRGWLSASDTNGKRRLDDPDDFVRIEIESALKRDVRVIPVLVDGADMPKAEELPDGLKPLARRQGHRLSHAGFASEAQALVFALEPLRTGTRGVPTTPKAAKPVAVSFAEAILWVFLAVSTMLVFGLITMAFFSNASDQIISSCIGLSSAATTIVALKLLWARLNAAMLPALWALLSVVAAMLAVFIGGKGPSVAVVAGLAATISTAAIYWWRFRAPAA